MEYDLISHIPSAFFIAYRLGNNLNSVCQKFNKLLSLLYADKYFTFYFEAVL